MTKEQLSLITSENAILREQLLSISQNNKEMKAEISGLKLIIEEMTETYSTQHNDKKRKNIYK